MQTQSAKVAGQRNLRQKAVWWGLLGLALLLVAGALVWRRRTPENPLPVWCVAFSPDGKTIATGGGMAGRPIGGLPGELIFWDTATGRRRVIPYHGSVRRVVWSQDGSFVALGTLSGKTELVRPITGKPMLTLSPPNELLNGVAVSRDGKRIVSAGLDGSIELWDNTGKEDRTLRRDQEQFVDVALSPDGRAMVATTRSGKALFYDLTREDEPVVLAACDDRRNAECVAFAPDGRTFVTGAQATLRLWETASGKRLWEPAGAAEINGVAYAPDGKFIATVDASGRLALVNPNAGELIKSTLAHSSTVFALAISPDSRQIATAARDDFTLRIWRAPTLEPVNSFRRSLRAGKEN